MEIMRFLVRVTGPDYLDGRQLGRIDAAADDVNGEGLDDALAETGERAFAHLCSMGLSVTARRLRPGDPATAREVIVSRAATIQAFMALVECVARQEAAEAWPPMYASAMRQLAIGVLGADGTALAAVRNARDAGWAAARRPPADPTGQHAPPAPAPPVGPAAGAIDNGRRGTVVRAARGPGPRNVEVRLDPGERVVIVPRGNLVEEKP